MYPIERFLLNRKKASFCGQKKKEEEEECHLVRSLKDKIVERRSIYVGRVSFSPVEIAIASAFSSLYS